MWKQFIGSSNIYRSYDHNDFPDFPKFEIVNCTNKEVFATALDNIKPGKGELIISVLENFLCDAVRDLSNPDEMNAALDETIKEYLTMVKVVAEKRPDVRIALAQLTLRPRHQWFMDCHEAFCKDLGEGIRVMDKRNVGKLDGPIKMSQVFESDGVHLTPASQKVFINTLLFNADAFFNAEVINLEEEMITNDIRMEEEIDTEKKKNLQN